MSRAFSFFIFSSLLVSFAFASDRYLSKDEQKIFTLCPDLKACVWKNAQTVLNSYLKDLGAQVIDVTPGYLYGWSFTAEDRDGNKLVGTCSPRWPPFSYVDEIYDLSSGAYLGPHFNSSMISVYVYNPAGVLIYPGSGLFGY
jgi:hypothetical protein